MPPFMDPIWLFFYLKKRPLFTNCNQAQTDFIILKASIEREGGSKLVMGVDIEVNYIRRGSGELRC